MESKENGHSKMTATDLQVILNRRRLFFRRRTYGNLFCGTGRDRDTGDVVVAAKIEGPIGVLGLVEDEEKCTFFWPVAPDGGIDDLGFPIHTVAEFSF